MGDYGKISRKVSPEELRQHRKFIFPPDPVVQTQLKLILEKPTEPDTVVMTVSANVELDSLAKELTALLASSFFTNPKSKQKEVKE
jgi:gluconate kinase